MNVYNMFGEWTVTDCHAELWNINHVGNEAKDDTTQDF